MKPQLVKYKFAVLLFLLTCAATFAQEIPYLLFDFEGNIESEPYQFNGKEFEYINGLDGQALALSPETGYNNLMLDNLWLNGTRDFSIQCWIKTNFVNPMVFLSQKSFNYKGIDAQKNPGWVLYSSGGTFGWSIGSGDRRINYERDNGEQMPVNDGVWHQFSMTYNKALSEIRLYYDGNNKAIYKVHFDFTNTEPLVIGSVPTASLYENNYSSGIETGMQQLQALVDEFNSLELENLKDEEFLDLIVNPESLFDSKQDKKAETIRVNKEHLTTVLEIRKKLSSNPYTVFQNRELTNLKPVSKIYALKEGKVVINKIAGKYFTQNEKLYPSDFAIDNLAIWEKTLSAEEVINSYHEYKKVKPAEQTDKLENLTIGVWNIWHGGIHWSLDRNGWDSRLRIVEMIKNKNIDVVLMQETYSSGDFIAAELGYYYATSSDWDYCFQGANISVISRYPIQEVKVLGSTSFNNVAVKLALSKTQEIWAMSNWYGMSQFPEVFDFHESRFNNTDKIPVVFGGDFNAVPHTDGGDSPASISLMEKGFTDAFRGLYPDLEKNPGFTHRNGRRIDQLYYKGRGLNNKSTNVVSTWPTGFPSDHFLIVSKFELDY